jgi:hypothetical protein
MKIVTWSSNICMTLLYVTPHYEQPKANHSASIIGSIMQTRLTKLLMWQLINEERGD